MKVHLARTSNTTEGIVVLGLACTKDPFIKGLTLSREDFRKKLKEQPTHCCKKCIKIFNKTFVTVSYHLQKPILDTTGNGYLFHLWSAKYSFYCYVSRLLKTDKEKTLALDQMIKFMVNNNMDPEVNMYENYVGRGGL